MTGVVSRDYQLTAKKTKTRTVRKSDYTPALALTKHMAGISDENCREKENTGKNK